MTYIILMLILLYLIGFSYIIYGKDILSPSVISCCMFFLCTLFAFIGLFSWNVISDISFKTIVIIVLGIVSFMIGEFFARITTKKEKKNIEKRELKIIKIDKWKLILVVLGILITSVLLIHEIKRICAFYGFSSNNLPELLAFYRTKTLLFSTDAITDGVEMNFLVKQMQKTCDVVCALFMYIVANNIIAKDKKKNIILYSIPLILALLTTLLKSGRSSLMRMLVGFVIIYLIIYKYKNKKIPKKGYIYLLLILIISLVSFYFIGSLVGRKSTNDIIEYLTFYLGTPLPSFEYFLHHPPIRSSYFGYETFSNVYLFLSKIKLMNAFQIGSREFVNGSNVYMSFRRYYFDFGILGVIICQFIFGFVISKIYLKVKDLDNIFLLIVYGYYVNILIDQIRDEQFFGLLSSSTIVYLIILYVLYLIYLKIRIYYSKKE